VITELLTAAGLIFVGIGLLYAARQLRLSKNIANSDFFLHYYEIIQQYNDIHAYLTENGPWVGNKGGPGSEEEWARVDRYMGLLEVMQILIEDKLLDKKTMDRLYSHRIVALVGNQAIYQRNLVERRYRWSDFEKLQNSLEGEKAYSALVRKEGISSGSPVKNGGEE
jgi:hypothetical protein